MKILGIESSCDETAAELVRRARSLERNFGLHALYLACGFLDSFRTLYPEKTDAYSWWSYKFQSRQKNVGWRIDYFLLSERLRPLLQDSRIHSGIPGSDHCPVSLVLADS